MRIRTEMASHSTSKTSEVASAINNLLHFEEGDQAALLDVIKEYFTTPSASSSACDPDSDSESEPDVAGKCNK